MNTFLSILGAIIALLEVGFIIFKYSQLTKRKRRSKTISIYNKIFNDTYKLRDKYYTATNKKTFFADDIRNNSEIYKSVMNHLTLLESFARELDYGVYDFKTFVYLTPNELLEIFSSLKEFVNDEKKIKSYKLLFIDFMCLTNVMHFCIQTKLQGKKNKI